MGSLSTQHDIENLCAKLLKQMTWFLLIILQTTRWNGALAKFDSVRTQRYVLDRVAGRFRLVSCKIEWLISSISFTFSNNIWGLKVLICIDYFGQFQWERMTSLERPKFYLTRIKMSLGQKSTDLHSPIWNMDDRSY